LTDGIQETTAAGPNLWVEPFFYAGAVQTSVLDDPTAPEDQPESDVGVDIPEVDVPEVDTAVADTPEADATVADTPEGDATGSNLDITIPDGSDAPAGLRASFWGVVLLFNVALLLVSVGPMFALILGRWRTGGTLFAVGAVAFGLGVRRVRAIQDEFD
jgi:hypothetical protein